MGFYSLYRIFKDIIKSIFGSKAWRYVLIVAIIVTVFTIYSSKVNAAENHDYVVDYYTTYQFKNEPSDSYRYFVTMIPVFANSSYSISWPSGYFVRFAFVDNISREITNVLEPYSAYSNGNDQGSYGYFAVKDGYLFCTYVGANFPSEQPFSYTILTDYDFTSNLATIHNDLLSLLGGEGDGIDTDFAKVNGLAANISGSFATSSSFDTIYFKVKSGSNYSVSFDNRATTSDLIRYGYTNSIPSNGASYITQTLWGSANYPKPITFNSNRDGYFYVSYYKDYVSNISVSNNNNLMATVQNESQATRDTMTDSSISQNSSDYTLPTDSTSDITASGFASIFDRIKNTFTNPTSSSLVVPVPFTGKSFTISKQSVYGSANLGIVQTLIESFWWYLIGLFVCKDVFKKIEKLKTGNIEFTETTNIKEDIL